MGAQASKERQQGAAKATRETYKRSSCICCFGGNAQAVLTPSGSPIAIVRASITRQPAPAVHPASSATSVIPVADIFTATKGVIAAHFQPPSTPQQQEQAFQQHAGDAHADDVCFTSTSYAAAVFDATLDTAHSSVNSCMSPCTDGSLLAGHSNDDMMSGECSAECALTSCMVTTTTPSTPHVPQQHMTVTCHPDKLIGLSALGTPVSTTATGTCLPQPVHTAAQGSQAPCISTAPASSKSKKVRPCIVIPEPPTPPAHITFEVDPVLVAGLLLMHSQGRRIKELPTGSGAFYYRREAQLHSLWHHPLGMCQLPAHIIHWLAVECDYSAYGRPPKPSQLLDMHVSIYFAAAFCQVVGSYLRSLGKGSLLGPSHPALHTAQRIASSTSYGDDDNYDGDGVHASMHPPSPASHPASSPGGAYGSGIVLPHQPYISAMWPESPAAGTAAVPAATTTAAAAAGTANGAVTAPIVPSPWFDTHGLLPLPRFDQQDIASYTHVIVCTYCLHAAGVGPCLMPSPTTVPSDNTPLRMVWAQYAAGEPHLARLQTALLKRESLRKGEEPLTMYMAGLGDSLASIAAAAQVSEEDLLLANPGLCNELVLRPHDCLALPVASIIPKLYCLQASETLCSTATKHAASLHKLLQCNTQLRKLNPRAPLQGWLVELPGLYGHI